MKENRNKTDYVKNFMLQIFMDPTALPPFL